MTARTSWSVRAEEPPRRDIDPGSGRGHQPLFADLLDSRFDESGRLVRRGGEARGRVAERLGRDLPDVGADELEQAVARLSRQVEAAARAGAAPRSAARAGASRQQAERQPPGGSVLDMLNRLEARLDSLSERAERRPAGHAGRSRREPDAGRDALAPDPPARWGDVGHVGATPQASASDATRETLERLARQIESLDRNDRSLAHAMDGVRDQLGDLRHALAERPATNGEELALIAERLEALGERLAAAEIAPSALSAVERSYEHLLERIGRMERFAERAAPPADLWDRLERLRRHVQALPGQEALSTLEDRILALAERIDAAAERGGGGRATERLEGQLDDMAQALAGLKQAEQARARDIEARLAELLRRLEAAPRGTGAVEVAAIEARLDEVLARIDGAPAPQFAEAIASLEARLDILGQALDERPAVDLDPLSRQLRQLQGQLDQVSQVVTQRGDRAPLDIEPLNRRLEEIQQRLETSPSAGAPGDTGFTERLRAIEERLSGRYDAPLPDLEPVQAQLASLAERLEGVTPGEQPDAARLTALMERLEGMLQAVGGEDSLATIGEKIGKISAALDHMSDAPALEEIAELRTEIALLRREMRSLPGGEAAAGAALEPLLKDLAGRLDRLPTEAPLTIADLEAQIDRIVRMIEEPGQDRQAFGPIEESLRRIEEQLESGSRAALESALSDTHGLPEGEGDGFTRLVSALSADLGSLKDAATSSQRNMRETLEAVHATLEGVVKRMAVLEGREAMGGAPGPPAAPVEPARRQPAPPPAADVRPPPAAAPVEPSYDPAPIPEIALGAAGIERPAGEPRRAPRPAADPAPSVEPESAGPQSLLGRLTSGQLLKRATGGRAESFSPAPEEADDGPDLPLEPGTEEPMSSTLENAPSSDTALFSGADRRRNRVPGRAGAINRRSDDGGYVANDFLSAARRAAQAAATEAAEAEQTTQTDHQVGALTRLFGAMKARRRMMIAGALALAVAFAALQFAKLRMGDAERRLAQAPAVETSEPGPLEAAPAPVVGEAEAPPDDPPQPDSTLAFGEPLALPGELQRRPDAAAASDQASAAAAPQSGSPVGRDSWPPDSIGPETLRRAAGEGDPAAQFEVAARYAEGRGVAQDLEMAAQWYRRAAEGGLAPAQYRLGSIYEKGLGVAKDPAVAMEWYRRAAQAGNAKAMHNLAVLYAEGVGGSSDLGRAAEWFLRAAEHGVRDSQFNIGVLHARGLGVPLDLVEAYKWFAVAAQSGDSQAQERRNVLAQSMSEEDLARARAGASAFRPLLLDPAVNVIEPPEGGWGDPPPGNVSLGNPDLVRAVQDLLAARGFDVGPADGRFGPRTRSAVAAFQQEIGLPATGEIDAGVVVALQQQAI